MKNAFDLPQNLPVPQDDGQCDHLFGAHLPPLELESTSGRVVSLTLTTQKPMILFCYPRTGEPDVEIPNGWDDFPGARGCTPQSCEFRDLYQCFQSSGFEVFGLSTQSTAYQQEFVDRMHIPFEILSDARCELTDLLGLPTFIFEGERLLKRMAFVISSDRIVKVFYPVSPPDQNASTVLNWIENRITPR